MTDETKAAQKMAAKRKRLTSPEVSVDVTREDIDGAIPQDSSHCMIADAIKRMVPGASRVSVDLATIRWTDSEKKLRYTYLTPRHAQGSLLAFDKGQRPEPFSFNLTRAAQITRAGSLKKARPDDLLPRKRVQKEAGTGSIPTIIGGKAPPVFAKGTRREFGLRVYATPQLTAAGASKSSPTAEVWEPQLSATG
ncbi:MAG: hypothetical protein WBF43_12935 [Methylocella sp.]